MKPARPRKSSAERERSEPGARDNYRREARCAVCLTTPGLCVCDRLPRISLPVRFVVIRHAHEIGRQSNTGSILPRLLTNCTLLDHGRLGTPLDTSELVDPETERYVLFPRPDAEVLGPQHRWNRSPRFILLDGTWPRARRMSFRIPALHGLPFLRLPDGPPPGPALRKPISPDRVCTLEALIRAVSALGFESEARELRAAADLVVQRRLIARGKLPRAAAAPPQP